MPPDAWVLLHVDRKADNESTKNSIAQAVSVVVVVVIGLITMTAQLNHAGLCLGGINVGCLKTAIHVKAILYTNHSSSQ